MLNFIALLLVNVSFWLLDNSKILHSFRIAFKLSLQSLLHPCFYQYVESCGKNVINWYRTFPCCNKNVHNIVSKENRFILLCNLNIKRLIVKPKEL